MAAAIATGYSLLGRPTKFTNKDSIVLGDFDNETRDPVFDDALRQGLLAEISQSPFVYLVPDRKISAILNQMGHTAGDRLTPQITREVCLRTNSTAMLTGSIDSLGSHYVIRLQAVDCNSGSLLAEAQQQATSKEAILKALDDAATDLRGELGESLGSVEEYSTPLKEATTPSLEALKAYSLGLKTSGLKGDTAALPFYKRALELDPNFAVAYSAIATSYNNLNEERRSQESVRKAYDLRGRLSEHERLSIEANYYLYQTGELEKAAQVYERWLQIYPRDYLPYKDLSFIYGNLGNFEEAVRKGRKAISLEPNDEVDYSNLGNDYVALNRLEDAESVYRQAAERKLQGESLLQVRYILAALKGDTAQMTEWSSAAMGMPGTEDVMLAEQADTDAWYGRWKDARQLSRRAMDSAKRNDAQETAAGYQAEAALCEADLGYKELAGADAKAAVKVAPNRDVRTLAALTLARVGDAVAAERLAAELDQAFPLDTLVQKYRLPTIRAAIALRRKDPTRALELLSVAAPIELGDTGFLLPVYVRGDAYLMLHDDKAAAAEFQRFLVNYGLIANVPLGALARLGLARAYALDAARGPAARDKARTAYQNFLTLWKYADPSIPIYRQAKAEYSKLQCQIAETTSDVRTPCGANSPRIGSSEVLPDRYWEATHVFPDLGWSPSYRRVNQLDEKSANRRLRAGGTSRVTRNGTAFLSPNPQIPSEPGPDEPFGRFTSTWRAVPSPDPWRLRGSDLPHAGFWLTSGLPTSHPQSLNPL